MLRKILIISLLLLITVIKANAQVTTGTITAASSGITDCNSNNCVELQVTRTSNTITFTVVHTGTSTSIFEFSTNNRVTWNTLSVTNIVSSATTTAVNASGVFAHVNLNYSHVRVRNNNSFSSGSQSVTINANSNSAITSLAFGGGSGGTIGTVNQGTASLTENWRVNCISGCAGGTTDTDDGSIATGQSTGISVGLNHVYNGATWGRLTFGQAVMASSLPVTIASNQTALPVTGTFFQATQPVSAVSLPLPTGAATETTLSGLNAKLPAPVALTDNTANPTLTGFAAYNLCWDSAGGNWDRCPPATGGGGGGVSVNEDNPSANGDPGTPVYSVRTDSLSITTSNNGDYQPLKSTPVGSLFTTLVDSAGAFVATSLDFAANSAEVVGAPGPQIVTLRKDVPVSSATTNSRYSPIISDSLGLSWTRSISPCTGKPTTTKAFSTTTDLVLTSASALVRNHICGMVLYANAAETIAIWEGTGTACGTGSVALAFGETTGTPTEANGALLPVGAGFVVPMEFKANSVNTDICIRILGSNRVVGFYNTVQE